MIVDNIDARTDEDFDLFSFAGRVAFVGGTGMAIKKTYEEYKNTPIESTRRDLRSGNKRMKEQLRRAANRAELASDGKTLLPMESFGAELSKDVKNNSFKQEKVPFRNKKKFKEILKRTQEAVGTNTKYDFDHGLPKALEGFVEKNKENIHSMHYKEVDGQIAGFEFNMGKDGKVKHRIDLRQKGGRVWKGKSMNSPYVSGGVATGIQGGDFTIKGPGTYKMEELAKDSSLTSARKIEQQLDQIIEHDPTGSAYYSQKFNQEVTNRKAVASSKVIMADGLDKNNAAIGDIIRAKGYYGGTEADKANLVAFVGDEYGASPHNAKLGQNISPNSHQTSGTAKVVSKSTPEPKVAWDTYIQRDKRTGNIVSSRVTNSNNVKSTTVSLNTPEARAQFQQSAKELGYQRVDLSAEGIIQDSNFKVKLHESNRSLKVSIDTLGEAGKDLLLGLAEGAYEPGLGGANDRVRIEKMLNHIAENGEYIVPEERVKKVSDFVNKTPVNKKLIREHRATEQRLSRQYDDQFAEISNIPKAQREGSIRHHELSEQLQDTKDAQREHLRLRQDTVYGDEKLLPDELKAERKRLLKRREGIDEAEKAIQDSFSDIKSKKSAPNPFEQTEKSRKELKKEFGELRKKESKVFNQLSTRHTHLGQTSDGTNQSIPRQRMGSGVVSVRLDSDGRTLSFGLLSETTEKDSLKGKAGTDLSKREGEGVMDLQAIFKHAGIEGAEGATHLDYSNPLPIIHELDSEGKFSRSVDWGKLDRNASVVIGAISENHYGTGNTALDKVFHDWGMSKDGVVTRGNGRKDYMNFLDQIGKTFDPKLDRQESITRAILEAETQLTSAGGKVRGVSKSSYMMAIQEEKVEAMGVGGLSSMSERQAMNLSLMGMDSLTEEIYHRKTDKGRSLLALRDYDEMQSLIDSPNVKGIEIGQNKEDLNSLLHATSSKPQTELIERMKKNGQVVNNNVVIDLGQDMGNKKVVISLSEMIAPHVSAGHGGSDLSPIQKTIKNLLRPELSTLAREEHYKVYESQMKNIGRGIEHDVFSGKVNGSMYSKVSPYQDSFKHYIKKNGLGDMNVVFMHEADIKSNFGSTALAEVRKGNYNGIFTREPSESVMSSAGTRVVSAEQAHKGYAADGGQGELRVNTGQIYVPDAEKSFYRAMFGDFDGDSVSFIGSHNQELKDFVDMNADTKAGKMGRVIRDHQKEMAGAAATLKSQAKVNPLSESFANRIALTQKQAVIGQGNIGMYSNELSKVHMGISSKIAEKGMLNLSQTELKGFLNLESHAHLFIENILKAKHMSAGAIEEGVSDRVLADLMGTSKADRKTRVASVQGFLDDLIYGEHIKQKSLTEDAFRKYYHEANLGSKIEASVLDNDVNKIFELKKGIASPTVVAGLIDAADAGQKMGTSKDNVLDMVRTFGGDPTDTQSIRRREQILSEVDQLKKVGSKGLGAFAKMAIMPAAMIGLIGTLTSTPKEIKIQRESETGGKNRQSGQKQSMKANNGTQRHMAPGRHRQVSMAGSISGESQLIRDMEAKQSAVRLTDHRSPMDKYDLQSVIDQGF